MESWPSCTATRLCIATQLLDLFSFRTEPLGMLGGAVEVGRGFEKLEFTVRGSLLSLAQDGRQLLAGKRSVATKILKGDPSNSLAWSPLPGLSGCFTSIEDDQTAHSGNRPSSGVIPSRRSR
jgi:hypothetical protein